MKYLVYIQTFGCQMNKLDSELIANVLVEKGYKLADSEESADIILLNACSVRAHAEERVYNRLSLLSRLKKSKPNLILGLVGCMAQKDKELAFKRLPQLNLVCGPHRYKTLVNLINEAQTKKKHINCTDQAGLLSDENPERTNQAVPPDKHSYIQAMRGCDNYCSYCIVPYVRGKEVSRPIRDIVTETNSLVSRGINAITLLGQNITAYGVKRNPAGWRDGHNMTSGKSQISLSILLRELHSIDNLNHIGFITGHPAFVTVQLLETMATLPKIRRELHMPAQSGSDRILKLMNRGYTAQEYLNITKEAHRLMPDIKIISDFIVGFPAETDDDFSATVDLVKTAEFSKIFVFKYSSRPGTAAAKMPDDVPLSVKKERNNILLDVQKKIHNLR
ncbi:MAG: tRNA (N6-isopentenyl adenosine(37)-C2)-methylthiotransferase MiaB [Planctomycetota bacterium]